MCTRPLYCQGHITHNARGLPSAFDNAHLHINDQ